jgi:hypothetical protein
MGPKPGFFRKSNTSTEFVTCPNPAACLGIKEPDFNPSGDCSDHYRGLLCAECEPGYTIDSNYNCNKCPERKKNVTRLVIIMILFIILILWLIRY